MQARVGKGTTDAKRARLSQIMAEHGQSVQLSDLEAWILETIDNIGWYA
jgi:hypothetical protein